MNRAQCIAWHVSWHHVKAMPPCVGADHASHVTASAANDELLHGTLLEDAQGPGEGEPSVQDFLDSKPNAGSKPSELCHAHVPEPGSNQPA